MRIQAYVAIAIGHSQPVIYIDSIGPNLRDNVYSRPIYSLNGP